MRSFLIPALACLIGSAAQAADIRLADDPEYGCLVTLDGQIAEGDTAQLRDIIRQAATSSRFSDTIWFTDSGDGSAPDIDFKTPLNLCLDSPGGSLAEAMRLTETIYGRLGTMIRPDARCESACALVFMAGSYDTASDIGTLPSRHMHVRGRLGFHAPSLTVPQGNYDAATVARAYAVSVAATELIFRNLVKWRFAPSLAARMHATPPEEMFYVDTVREAARWGISVVGVDVPPWSDAVIRSGCTSAYRSVSDRLTSDPDDWFNENASGERVEHDGEQFSYTGFGMEALGTCSGFRIDSSDEWNMARQTWGPAQAVQESVIADVSFQNAEPPVFFALMQAYMAWPGELPLNSLPSGGQTFEFRQSGRCYVYSDDGALIDQEPCERLRQPMPDASLVDSHIWPSGAVTVIETMGMERSINGNRAGNWFWPDPRPEGAEDSMCARNDGSGNLFCFMADAAR